MKIRKMSQPAELSFDEILKFMLANNGKVTNHELVKHFKVFLMNPDMRDEARNTFKKHVNALAIIKNQNNEKWLILKKKYLNNPLVKQTEEAVASKSAELPVVPNVSNMETESVPQSTYKHPPPLQLNQDFNILANIIQDSSAAATPTQPSEIPIEIPVSESKESLTTVEETPPKIHPRKKSSDKILAEKRSSVVSLNLGSRSSIPSQDLSELSEKSTLTLSSSRSESMLIDNEQKISVKERKQMFNRMASESDVLKTQKLSFNNSSVDEEDRASLEQKETDPLDSKQKQWILCAARGEYHSLAKMCKENAKLVRTKDPFTYTAMHWACKRGDENLVKLLAGIHRNIVNERSGYTPLHIAMQFRHENVYRLLVEMYDADPNMRDWSGKKARQYLVHMDTSLSPGSYRKPDTNVRRTITTQPSVKVQKSYVQQLNKNEKEGFLRIGSLNVRVKKTTEAFSNFLGVGATRTAYVHKRADVDRRSDDGELHKSWGSADNIQKDDKSMPPPLSSKVRRRGASGRRGVANHSRSTPSTPDQPRAQIGLNEEGDSDSDSAAGFHSAWRQQRSSNQ